MHQIRSTGFSPLFRLPRTDLVPIAGLTLATLGFYLSPTLVVSLLAAAAFVALAWWRLDLGLLAIPITAPLFRFPKSLEAGHLLGRDAALEVSLVEFALCACLAAWGLRFLARRPHLSRTAFLPPAVFVAIALLSLPFSENRQVALREFRVIVLEPALYYLLVVSTLRSSADVGRFLWALVATGAVVAAYTFYDYLFIGITTDTGGVRRALAIYHSPNALALFLGRMIPIAAALSLPLLFQRFRDTTTSVARELVPRSREVAQPAQGQPPFLSIAAAVALALMLAATAITFSRGALLGIAAALSFQLVAAYRLPSTAYRLLPRAALIAVAVAILGLAAALPFLPLDRLGESGTVTQRLYLWQAALAMAADHPITGAGLDNFLYRYPQYMLPQAALEPDMSHPHNLFLDFLTRLGILGLAAFAWLQYLFWRNGAALLRTALFPHERLYVLALMGSMVDFLVHGLIDNSYFLIDLAYLFWLSFALLAVLGLSRDKPALSLTGPLPEGEGIAERERELKAIERAE